MAFKVAARTILQLGSELISSDGVAFYELIKNAFDAKTKKGVRIEVVVRIPYPDYRTLKEEVESLREKDPDAEKQLNRLRTALLSKVDPNAPDAEQIVGPLKNSASKTELLAALEEANFIEIRDTGEGMSREQLEQVYLTIGTRSRLDQREQNPDSSRPILGEKGIGRLSAMRLGMRLKVTTAPAGQRRWNQLEIDWKDFGRTHGQMLEEIEVVPKAGSVKEDENESGTTIRISDLNADWTYKRLREIAQQEFSRLMDPFSPSQMKMFFRFNGEPVAISPINTLLFDHADAYLSATVQKRDNSGFELRGEIIYKLRKRKKVIHLTEEHLISVAGLQTRAELESLGPFEMMSYWFNRRRLQAIEGIGDIKTVRALVDEWGGGLMLFRDGFRVHPYGGPSDDWLQLDPTAFKSQGYKVNRKQLIGKVEISNRRNPLLIDQTNREGLRDNLQKGALISILQWILSDLRIFLTNVDEELRQSESVDMEALEKRVEGAQATLQETVEQLLDKYPKERQIAATIRGITEEINEIMSQAKEVAQGLETRQSQLVHLAGIGLMVEIVAHELNRATQFTLSLLANSDFENVPDDVQRTLDTLESQLKTLQKRLRILDPLSTAGRQVKERFDLGQWIHEIVEGHKAQFDRHEIHVRFKTVPPSGQFRIRAVKGMVVEVIENLISNSVYWLKRAKVENPKFRPEIEIVIDSTNHEVRFSDNGPGIQKDQREEVFLPFVTTKPAREGKGLGLYIAKEIANYNGGKLYLSEKSTAHPDVLNTFIFELPPEST
jgi:signal transduction histidine kinase